MLSLMSCSQTTDFAVKDDVALATSFCAAAKPFEWDKLDTRDTIIQAKQHNAVGKILECQRINSGWRH